MDAILGVRVGLKYVNITLSSQFVGPLLLGIIACRIICRRRRRRSAPPPPTPSYFLLFNLMTLPDFV